MKKLTLLFLAGLIFFVMAMPVGAFDPDDAVVVEIQFSSPEQLADLAARLDIWHVDHAASQLTAYISPTDAVWLHSENISFSEQALFAVHPQTIPAYPCYRTVTELYAQLDQWALQYTDIVRLSTIGQSYEGRPLKMMHLTNRNTSGNKPTFFLLANIHGRELITNETAMAFIEYLLENYGTDADATWLLDHHNIYVMVSGNPDGHVKNEPGEPWAWWRKNTNPSNGTCGGSSDFGIDLNRNSSFKWGNAGTDPCEDTYQGPSAASESETQTIQNFMDSIFADQRGPGDSDAAPDDATGVFITLHSYSNLVLWPWGNTYSDAPNSAQLEMLGRKLASYNGYTPEQSSDLYTTTGSTDDWAYGDKGIASYTYEIGTSGDGFYPSCSRYDDLVEPNVDSLLYAAKVARTPYITAFGPDALDVVVDAGAALVGVPIQVQALIDDADNGGQTLGAAEVYIDTPPWAGGIAYPLAAVDGQFDEVQEAVNGSVPTTGLKYGRHLAFVRARDASGYWGPMSAVFFELSADSHVTGVVDVAVSGEPLPGVLVVAQNAGEIYSTTTSASGSYSMPLYAGPYTLTASLFGYRSATDVITVTSGATATLDFSLSRQPYGKLTLQTYELGTLVPLNSYVAIDMAPFALSPDPSASVELPLGVYTFTASADAHKTRSQTLTIAADTWITHAFYLPPNAPILVVDDDAGANYENYILPHLDVIDIPYDVWTVAAQGTVSADLLSGYTSVLWFTGDDYLNSLNVSEQSALNAYLTAGGRLFLSGQNIGADIKNDPGHFYRDMLRATFVKDASGVSSLNGQGIYVGISASLSGGSGADNQTSPDVIAPYDAFATSVFSYTASGESAGLAVARANYRLIYLAYGLEGVSLGAVREEILRQGLSWLEVTQPPAQLSMELNVSQPVLHHNMSATYTLTLLNNSLFAMHSGELTVTLPASITVLSTSPEVELVAPHVLHWDDLATASEGAFDFWWTLEVPLDLDLDEVLCAAQAWWPKLESAAQLQQITAVTPLYAMSLSPGEQSHAGFPEEQVTHILTLLNTGDAAETFAITQTASNWNTNVMPLSVTLASGSQTPITVVVSIPEESSPVLPLGSDVVTITAVALSDITVKDSAVLTTGLLTTSLFLPVILRNF